MSRIRWPRLGLRREILILLPVTVFLLVVISSFTLFAYRSAVELLTEERQREIGFLTQRMAQELATTPLPATMELRRRAPMASRIIVATTEGETVRSFGPPPPGDAFGPLAGHPAKQSVAIGPSKITEGLLVGFTPFTHQGRSLVLRVDVPGRELARQRQAVAVLTWVVLPTNVALLVLALAFLPHFLRPYDTLIETVQSVAPETTDRDDIATLVSTIERALTTLASATEETPEDDILALQRALGTDLESGVMLIDIEGRILTLNRAGSAMLDVDPVTEPTVVSDSLQAHPQLVDMLSRAVDRAEGLPRQEIQIQTRSGARTLGFTVHTLRRDDGVVRGYLALFVDLTESHLEAEARQLETSLEQLGELAAGVAHELRNSVATLRGYLTLIDRHPDEESITDYLREIRRESDHLERVVRDFLAFAQPESVQVELIDLTAVAQDAVDDSELTQIPIATSLPATGNWLIRGDSQLVERALRNLLHNAVEAESESGGSGPIELALRRTEADEIEVRIDDRGPGVPAAVRQRLFQPFVSGRANGVGLGLSLAHRIATLHGGRLTLEDRADGGTRARLVFPAAASGPLGQNG